MLLLTLGVLFLKHGQNPAFSIGWKDGSMSTRPYPEWFEYTHELYSVGVTSAVVGCLCMSTTRAGPCPPSMRVLSTYGCAVMAIATIMLQLVGCYLAYGAEYDGEAQTGAGLWLVTHVALGALSF